MYYHDILVGDSRARGLYDNWALGFLGVDYVVYKRGATILDLAGPAGVAVSKAVTTSRRPVRVILAAGINDLSYRLRHGEVVFDESRNHVLHIEVALREFEIRVRHHGCEKVVFATISPMDFGWWNAISRSHGRVRDLDYSEYYPDMQQSFVETLRQVNSAIIEMNIRRQSPTPMLHFDVVDARGHEKQRVTWTRLVDGLHPTGETIDLWTKRLNIVLPR